MLISNFIKSIFINKNIIKNNKNNEEHKKTLNILEDTNNKLGVKINMFIIFLILFSVGVIIFESIGNYKVIFAEELYKIDGVISTIFAIEYFYRLFNARDKIKHAFKIMNIIDLLAFLPFFLQLLFEGLIGLSILKALRILRVFRIFKLLRHFKSIVHILNGLKTYKTEYLIGFVLVSIIIILSSILMYTVEGTSNPGFASVPLTIRWCIVTMATVGYGDVYPITTLGKILGSLIILIGPMFIAMISSITVLVFFEVAEKNKLDKIQYKTETCPKCFTKYHPHDSNYCKKCGKLLVSEKPKIKKEKNKTLN
ncbi:MAG: ion transporter [Candidatus Gracilibacteria bacterium]|nr:ion transporter [Candidatus Gracilibacteria bacterium]